MNLLQTLKLRIPIGVTRPATSSPNSVVVDSTALDTGHRERGIGRYVSGLLTGFAELDARDELDVPLAALRLDRRARERGRAGTVAGRLECWTLARPRTTDFGRWLLNELLLPRELEPCRLFHATEPWALPLSSRFATVATVHDVIPLLFPEHYLNRKHSSWRIYYDALRRSDRWAACSHVIAISHATKATIIEHLCVPENKITVVHNGVDHRQFRPPSEEELLRVRRTYDLERPFLLYLGAYDYRKNITTLVRAFARLRRGSDIELVLAGGMTATQRSELEQAARAACTRVRFLGYVDDGDVAALYALALAFPYPSLAEGFGLQALEAMALGCPVVAANQSSLPEIVGDAGLLADPRDPDDLARALSRIIDDSALRRSLVHRGRTRSQMFCWQRCARETLAVYRRLQ